MDAKPSATTNILEIRFADTDRRLATDIVNSLTDKYVQHHIRIYAVPGTA